MLGIFGGTFDPIHFGHLRPALELLQTLPLDQIAWVPCRQPPHREQPVASADTRVRMLQAAVDGVAGFDIDRRELHRSGPSYMVDTLRSLRAEAEQRRLCLLLGMDAFLGLAAWHEWRMIVELAHVVVAERPGWQRPASGELGALINACATRSVDDLLRQRAGRILFQPVTQLEISATAIRSLAQAGKSVRYLVPDGVRDIIEHERVYAPPKGA